jgi:hypothetical protein
MSSGSKNGRKHKSLVGMQGKRVRLPDGDSSRFLLNAGLQPHMEVINEDSPDNLPSVTESMPSDSQMFAKTTKVPIIG